MGNGQPRDGGVRAQAELCLQKAEVAWVWGEGDRNPAPSGLSSPPGVLVQLTAKSPECGSPDRGVGETGPWSPGWELVILRGPACGYESKRQRKREGERDEREGGGRSLGRDSPSFTVFIAISLGDSDNIVLTVERIMAVSVNQAFYR